MSHMAVYVTLATLCFLFGGLCFVKYGLQDAPSQVQQVVLELKHTEPKGTETVLLNTTFFFTQPNGNSLPLLFLLNGFNCQSFEYSRLLESLARSSYLAVVTDFRHHGHVPIPPRPGCPNDSYLVPTSSILNTVLEFANAAVAGKVEMQVPEALVKAMSASNRDDVLLIGHSAGGSVGLSMVTVGEHAIPAGRFVSYLGGSYNGKVHKAFQNTTGCKSYVRFKGSNHYGINNFFPDSKHQVAQCGQQLPSDPADFSTTRKAQDRVVDLIAQTVDKLTRAYVLEDEEAKLWLERGLQDEEVVAESEFSC